MRTIARLAAAAPLVVAVLGIGSAANATTVNNALAAKLTRLSAP